MKKAITSIILILAVTGILFSENYTLEDLIEKGLEKSYGIANAETSLENSRSSFRSSLFGLLPNSSVNYNNVNSESVIPGSNGKSERQWIESAGFSISKTISLNEPSYYNIRSSIFTLKNSELSYIESRKEIAYTVFSRYLNVLEAQKSLVINQENLALQTRIHDQIRVQYETGEKSLLDLKQSEINLIDYEIAVNESENSLVQQRRDLFTYINMEDQGNFLAEPELTENELQTDLEFVVNNELLQKQNSLKTSRLYLFQRFMDFFPTINLSYSYSGNSPGEDIYEFSDYSDSYTISLTASYDIFNIFDKRENYVTNRRNLQLQELDYDLSVKGLNDDIANLRNDILTLKHSKNLYETKLELASENLEMAQEQYRLGIISLLDLDRAQIDYQDAQLSYNNKYYNLMRKQEGTGNYRYA